MKSHLSPTNTFAAVAAAAVLSACAGTMDNMPTAIPMFSQAMLPAAVQVPTGHRVAMETVGVGQIAYECRQTADRANVAEQFEWVFAGPEATLQDRKGGAVGRYFGPPATWALNDGSALTGTQVAVAPAAAGSIPYQLVKANLATGSGALVGVTHIQRVDTKGGVAPVMPCGMAEKGKREVVKYQADYIFWKAA